MGSSDTMDASYRYADDFLIGIIGSREEAISVMQSVADFIGNKLHLEIATEKSGLVHASDEVRFLGYDVRAYSSDLNDRTIRSGRCVTVRSMSERMQLHIPAEKL